MDKDQLRKQLAIEELQYRLDSQKMSLQKVSIERKKLSLQIMDFDATEQSLRDEIKKSEDMIAELN